jgi:hypothetical protein
MNGEVSQTVPPVQAEEDLDRLLEAFFRSEVPDPWPAFTPPRVMLWPPAVRGGRRSAGRTSGHPLQSRLALAASVALLLAGLWLLGSRPLPPGKESLPGVESPEATRPLLPDLPSEGGRSSSPVPEKVKSSLTLEQGDDGRTGIRITVEELPDR